MDMSRHQAYMQLAYEQALKAAASGEVPIGTVLVYNDQILSSAHNQTQLLKDPTAHAELLAITNACAHLQSKYLTGSILYCTIEPCLMCYGAIRNAHIRHLVYGASEPKMGFTNYISPTLIDIRVEKHVLQKECRRLMQTFFTDKR